MTSKYIKQSHSLQEQSNKNYPRRADFELVGAYMNKLALYEEHLKTLRTIPCQESMILEDGKIYTEGIDYRIEVDQHPDWKPTYNNPDDPPTIIFAIPILKEDDLSIWSTDKEDDTWRDFFFDMFNKLYSTEELKKHYTITKKTV